MHFPVSTESQSHDIPVALNSRTELPAPLPPCDGCRVRRPAPHTLRPGSGSDACGVGPIDTAQLSCVCLQGLGRHRGEWAGPPGTQGRLAHACPKKGKTLTAGLKKVPTHVGPEHGAITRASVRPLTPNPLQPAKAPQPEGAAQTEPSGSGKGVGAAPRAVTRALGPRGRAARGEEQHVERRRKGHSTWRCCCTLHGASAHGACIQKGADPSACQPTRSQERREAAAGTCRPRAAQAPRN